MTRGLSTIEGGGYPMEVLEERELVLTDLQPEHFFSSLQCGQCYEILVPPVLIRTHRHSPPQATW